MAREGKGRREGEKQIHEKRGRLNGVQEEVVGRATAVTEPAVNEGERPKLITTGVVCARAWGVASEWRGQEGKLFTRRDEQPKHSGVQGNRWQATGRTKSAQQLWARETLKLLAGGLDLQVCPLAG